MSVQSSSAQNLPEVNGGICNGMALSIPKPEIPQSVIDANGKEVFGIVNVQVLIDEKGNVEKARAVTGHPLMRPVAEKSAINAKFKINGDLMPAKISCVLVYNFSAFAPNKSESKKSYPIISCGRCGSEPISLEKPEYPKAAKYVMAKGTVNVEILIDENGNIESAKAVSGHPLLRAESEKAALKTRFKPKKMSGKPVKVRGIIVYNFVS